MKKLEKVMTIIFTPNHLFMHAEILCLMDGEKTIQKHQLFPVNGKHSSIIPKFVQYVQYLITIYLFSCQNYFMQTKPFTLSCRVICLSANKNSIYHWNLLFLNEHPALKLTYLNSTISGSTHANPFQGGEPPHLLWTLTIYQSGTDNAIKSW